MCGAGLGSAPAAGMDGLFQSRKERFNPQEKDIDLIGTLVEGNWGTFASCSGCA